MIGWRADRSTLAGLLVTFFLISACCAHAQAKLDEVRDLARTEIARLEQTWRADRQALTFKDLNLSAPGLWASGDEAVLLRSQDLWISMAIRDRNVSHEIGGRLLAFSLTHALEDVVSEDTAWASLALGQTYLKDADSFREGAHYALYNALGACEALERRGRGGDEFRRICAQAHALLGQSLLQDERVAPASTICWRRSRSRKPPASRWPISTDSPAC